ncbi:hypothetical protein ACQRIT_002932 [Beauveria bassiana]
MLNLDTSNPKEQAIANALIQRFDKAHFQRLLLEWVVDANVSFRQPEHWRLRRVFEQYQARSIWHSMAGALETGRPYIAAQNMEILESYEILDKVGYITLDNAANMDTAVEEIADALGWDPLKRRVRCFDHVLNLVVKALLFGHKSEASEAEVDGGSGIDAAQHEVWRKKGPIGKLHNLIHWIHRSDKLTYRLRALQEELLQRSGGPGAQTRKPLDVVCDNQIRWLSTFYMIRRALKLRSFLDDLVEKTMIEVNRERRNGIRKKEELPLCLREESLSNERDWAVIELLEKVLVDFEEALANARRWRTDAAAQRRTCRGVREYLGCCLNLRIPGGQVGGMEVNSGELP